MTSLSTSQGRALLIFTFLLSLATSWAQTKLSLPADVKPFFVYRTVKDAWGQKSHNGIYCYAIEPEGVVGPFVDIYVVVNDKVTEMVSQGSNGKELLQRIRKIGLGPFDYKNELEKTLRRVTSEYQEKGQTFDPPFVLDGFSYEIIYDLDGTHLKIDAANPGHAIQALAPYSENIGKLNAVFKELMLYYAERKFGFK